MKFTRSTMRRAMYSVIAMAAVLILAVALSIVMATLKGNIADINWSEMGQFVLAISGLILPVIGGKVWQKNFEMKKPDNTEIKNGDSH